MVWSRGWSVKQEVMNMRSTWMKGLVLTVGLSALLTAPAMAWQPSGWVYGNWPYAYAHETGRWHYFAQNNQQWAGRMHAGGADWSRLGASDLAQGWSWHAWPYAYHSPTRNWHVFSANGWHWSHGMTARIWSVFGVPPAGEFMVINLTAGPAAANYPVAYYARPDTLPGGARHERYRTTHLVLRRIPAGSFTMGSPEDELGRFEDREAQRQVTLSRDYYIGVFPVTQQQWYLVMGTWPGFFDREAWRWERPVEQVSYHDIRAHPLDGPLSGSWPGSNRVNEISFMGRLRAKANVEADLPTEAQWEYACRAGKTSALNSGLNLTSITTCPNMSAVGRYLYNGGEGAGRNDTQEKGTAWVGYNYPPNTWGLYDMHGNVYEWCLDWYAADYAGSLDPPGPATGTRRVARGGSWASHARYCRSAHRSNYVPSEGGYYRGFRVAAPAAR
jgi:formylglycine-generating enzyme required for sulfatase activity